MLRFHGKHVRTCERGAGYHRWGRCGAPVPKPPNVHRSATSFHLHNVSIRIDTVFLNIVWFPEYKHGPTFLVDFPQI